MSYAFAQELDGFIAESERTSGPAWPVSRTTAWRWVKEVMDCAEISGIQATRKDIRHGFVVNCLLRNALPNVVQRWVGHPRLETTLSYYAAIIGDEERLMVDRLSS